MKIFKILVLTLISLHKVLSEESMTIVDIPKINGFYTCGRSNPLTEDDCFVANLDNGFRCCFVTQIPNNKDTCLLVSYKQYKEGKAQNGNYNCGKNISGSYIKYSMSFLLIIFTIFFN